MILYRTYYRKYLCYTCCVYYICTHTAVLVRFWFLTSALALFRNSSAVSVRILLYGHASFLCVLDKTDLIASFVV